MVHTLARIGGLDQGLEHIERNVLNAVRQGEPFVFREFLQHRAEPEQELVMRLDRSARALCIVSHRSTYRFRSGQGLRPWTRSKKGNKEVRM